MMDEHEGRGLTEFLDDRLEYRRLFSEVWGTFLLVLVAAGVGAVGAQPYGGGLILPVKVIAPGVMVMAIIYFMGTVSGAHLNPAVTWAFALRGNFPWRRVPGYVLSRRSGRSWRACSCSARSAGSGTARRCRLLVCRTGWPSRSRAC